MNSTEGDSVIEAMFRMVLTATVPILSAASDGVQALLGYSAEDFLSGKIALDKLIHPDDQDIAATLFSPVSLGRDGSFNIRIRQANGRIRCIKGHYSKQAVANGVALDLLLQDAKSLQRTVPDASKMINFVAMMENTDDYIYFKDRNHVFTGASQTLVSLCDPAEHWTDLLGQTDYDVFPEEYADIYYRLEKQVFAGIAVAHEVQETLTKNGIKGWVDNRKYPIRGENGEIIGLFGIARDITQLKEHEAELMRSNAELEQFSYAVSHDMRQPLRMISSYLQLLERSLAGQLDSEKRDYFNFAIEGAKRIDGMLVALLEYSRIGRMGEQPIWIDSRAVLDEALQFLQPAITEAQAKLSISGDWPNIFASHNEILRLLQNLIGNAIKYRIAGRTPEITVTSEIAKNEWCLCVADNGVGIIPDQIKRLFQVFQRLQSRETYEGTGIGLALCRKIAEHHKGRIWAESAGEGLGSKFCVALPVTKEKAA